MLLKFIVLAGMLLGFPMLGVHLAGHPLDRYLEFPPESRYVLQAPFSAIAFSAYALFIGCALLLLAHLGSLKKDASPPTVPLHGRPFPWWGWLGAMSGLIAWILAWTRFSWFSTFQPHTFTPLWLSLILVINGLCYRQRGRSMLVNRTGFFLLLFPMSALFWWLFEYLNRFVQNWYYVGAAFGPWEYFWYATLPFSTVLPAVLSVQEWMSGFTWIRSRFHRTAALRIPYPKAAAGAVLAGAALGLAGIGVWPDLLFSLLWTTPLLILIALQTLLEEPHVLSDAAKGNWVLIVSSALAALFCGLFWETWNYCSLAKWRYAVPYVHRFQIFEMPLLGYAGYLPFGLECVAVGKLLESLPIFSKTRLKPV